MQKVIKLLFIIVLMLSFKSVFAKNFDITNIHYSSPESIDIIFTGDGFTSSEQAFFVTKALEAEGYLMNSLPFNSRKSDFNTYLMELNSNESGISVLGGPTVDNFLGSYKNRDGMMRYTGMSEEGKNLLHENLRHKFKKKIYVVVILNDNTYGGSGEFLNDDLIGIAQSTYDTEYNLFRELVMHEFGHSFGNLADEYGGSCDDSSRPDDWNPITYDRKNVTRDAVNDRKWDFLSNPQYILGANYCDNEWYRSSNNGLMRSLNSGTEHNELGQYLINERIDDEINYNSNLESFITDTVSFDVFSKNTNIHIHADSVTFNKSLNCNQLYVAKGATLYMEADREISCNSIINLGNIVYKKRHQSGRTKRVSKERLEEIFGKKEIKKTKNIVNSENNINTLLSKDKCVFNQFDGLIRYGSIGLNVKKIQECMNFLGYFVGVEDGIYGRKTFEGIIKYQKDKKLYFIDGVVGPETIRSIEENL